MIENIDLAKSTIFPDVFTQKTPLSAVQKAAIDLYNRGLNVFPVCRPEEVRELARMYPNKFSPMEKLPYVLRPLFTTRLHLCSSNCVKKDGRICKGSQPGINFLDLFDYANLGVILGRTSGNLVCVDADTLPSFQEILKQFTNRGLPFWAYTTSRGGNILFRLAEGEAANLPKCNIPNVEILGNRRFCVLPPSLHATGVFYKWPDRTDPAWHLPPNEPPPTLNLAALEWLGIKLNKIKGKDLDLFGLPEWTSCLSENNRRILSSEIYEGERNTKLTATIYDVAAGINEWLVSYDEAERLLLWTASRCKPPYPQNQVLQMLQCALKKPDLCSAREHYSKSSTKDNVQFIPDQAECFLSTYDWSIHGRTAHTDRAVFAACITRAKMDRARSFRASAREVADLANIQQAYTASKSLHRLCDKGLLSFVEVDSSSANHYRFGEIVAGGSQHIIFQGEYSVLITASLFLPNSPIEQDIFLVLGRIPHIVWKFLQQSPEQGASSISQKINLNRKSVSDALKKLKELGFISYFSAEGLYVGEYLSIEELEAIAIHLGAFGRSDDRISRFNCEREIWANIQVSKAKEIYRRMRRQNPNGARKEM